MRIGPRPTTGWSPVDAPAHLTAEDIAQAADMARSFNEGESLWARSRGVVEHLRHTVQYALGVEAAFLVLLYATGGASLWTMVGTSAVSLQAGAFGAHYFADPTGQNPHLNEVHQLLKLARDWQGTPHTLALFCRTVMNDLRSPSARGRFVVALGATYALVSPIDNWRKKEALGTALEDLHRRRHDEGSALYSRHDIIRALDQFEPWFTEDDDGQGALRAARAGRLGPDIEAMLAGH